MGGDAIVADQLFAVNAVAGGWKFIVSTFRNFFSWTWRRRSTATCAILILDQVQQLYEKVIVDDVVGAIVGPAERAGDC